MRHQEFMASDRHRDGAQLPEVRAVRVRLYGTLTWARPLGFNDQGVEDAPRPEKTRYLAIDQPAAFLTFADLHLAERHRPPFVAAASTVNESETAC